jgi:hypothetical protein
MKRSITSVPMMAFWVMTLELSQLACSPSKRDLASAIVPKVEEFRQKHGRLPNDLSEMGIAEEDESCPCYCKTSNKDFIVWYGTTLGESDTYDSRTKKWTDTGQGVCAQ